jgi:uncharacterized protein
VVLPRMLEVGDPILMRFRAALADAHGERIERVVLFGSRARGDARPDSDYDVAVSSRISPGSPKRWGRSPRSRPTS